MEKIDILKKKFAGKNFIVFTRMVTAAVKNQEVRTYEDMQVLNCDTAIDLSATVKEITGEGGRIIYSELPGAGLSPRIGEISKLLRSFLPREPIAQAPAEVKTEAKAEEMKKRLGRPSKVEAVNE